MKTTKTTKTTVELVKDVLGGDMQAFELLYNDTSKKIYYVCYSFVKNEQDAMDLMQEAYLSALTHLSSLKEPERFTQWLSQIAVNKCKDFLAKNVPVLLEEEVLDSIPASEEELSLPEKYIIDREKRKILMDIMLNKLSAIQYQTVVLYYFNGLSQQEIASCMGCPEGTVSYRLSVAREKIKAGVLAYEEKSGEKLYCVAGIPFLAAFFAAEADAMVIPNVFSAIMGSAVAGGEAIVAAAATEVAGVTAGKAAEAVASKTAVKVAEVATKTATKTGVKALFQSATVKIATVVLGLAVVGGAGILIASTVKDGKEAEVKTESGVKNETSSQAEDKHGDTVDKKAEANEDFFLWEGNTIIGFTEEGAKQKSIVIPARCEGFNEARFYNTEVEHVTFEDNDDVDLEGVFLFAQNICSVELPKGLTVIPNVAFDGCYNLESITIPSEVTTIGEFAFDTCESLESVTFEGEGLTVLQYACFNQCKSLKSVVLPKSVTTIEDCAFRECESLETVTLNAGVKTIGKSAFASTALTELHLPEEIQFESVATNAFGVNTYSMVVYIVKDSWCDKNREVWDIGFLEIRYE